MEKAGGRKAGVDDLNTDRKMLWWMIMVHQLMIAWILEVAQKTFRR